MTKSIEELEQSAIDSAISQKWTDAISINTEILEQDGENISAMLRRGFAHLNISQFNEAEADYKKVLTLNDKNQIALSNLERIEILKAKDSTSQIQEINLNPSLFLETPGKTRTIELVTLGQKDELASLSIGQPLQMQLKKRKVEIRTNNGQYVGCLPDDISKRLIFFLKAKSVYECYVRNATLTTVSVFIVELEKGQAVANYTSFPANIHTNLDKLANETGEGDSDHSDADDSDDAFGDQTEIEGIASNLNEERDEDLINIKENQDEEEDEL